MTTTTVACIRGCTLLGEHLTSCDTRDAAVDPCRGCLPRRAEFGLLCAWDWQRFNADVVDAPGLVQHLRTLSEVEAAAAPPSDGRAYRDPAEGSILPATIGAADEIHALLAEYARRVVEDHPAHPRGPDETGVWRSLTTVHVNEYGPYLARSRVNGIRQAEATGRLVKWLLPHLAWVATQDWVGEARGELGTLIRITSARWPVEEDPRGRHVTDIPCPRCDRISLHYTPPTTERPTMQVACTNPQCARVFTEDEWDRMRALIARAAEALHKTDRTEGDAS